MTNFERIKEMKLEDVFEFMGFEESDQQTLKQWLESKTTH